MPTYFYLSSFSIICHSEYLKGKDVFSKFTVRSQMMVHQYFLHERDLCKGGRFKKVSVTETVDLLEVYL